MLRKSYIFIRALVTFLEVLVTINKKRPSIRQPFYFDLMVVRITSYRPFDLSMLVIYHWHHLKWASLLQQYLLASSQLP